MKVTWYGTAAASVETENAKVLFDPYVPMKGSPVRDSLIDAFISSLSRERS